MWLVYRWGRSRRSSATQSTFHDRDLERQLRDGGVLDLVVDITQEFCQGGEVAQVKPLGKLLTRGIEVAVSAGLLQEQLTHIGK